MATSSLANFISFSNSISNNLNATSFHITNSCPPPTTISVKRRRFLSIKCFGGAWLENKYISLEAINRYYKNIKMKSVIGVSKVIANQDPKIFDSIPFIPNNLKMLIFVSGIIKALQDSLEFSVHPTTKDGSMVGIKWTIEWNKPLELKKGVNIKYNHAYSGKLLFGNLETLLEPLLQLGPMKMINWNEESKSKEGRVAALCLGFFLLLVSLYCLQFSAR